MSVFARYTEESRRAVFYAQQTALHTGATVIESGHLFLGLLCEQKTRVNQIFRLREAFPDETAEQITLMSKLIKAKPLKGQIPLADDGKRTLAYTIREADKLQDHWIDTDHLLLGMVCVRGTPLADRLRDRGFDVENVRKLIVQEASVRPRCRAPLWHEIIFPERFGVALQIAFLIGVIVAMVLLWR
jgi:ATP-dependent Clp protease ATP-binding subunit ClpA